MPKKPKLQKDFYVVEGIVAKVKSFIIQRRTSAGKLEYKVKWKGYNRPEDMTWEPTENLQDLSQIIREFEVMNRNRDAKTGFKATFFDGRVDQE